MLHPQEALFVLEAGCDEIHSPYTLGGLLHPLYRRLRPEHCLKGIDGARVFSNTLPKARIRGHRFVEMIERRGSLVSCLKSGTERASPLLAAPMSALRPNLLRKAGVTSRKRR